jgi:hypothetical protein
MFKENPFHHSFRRKVIQSTTHDPNPHYEFRITRDYRATCFIDGDTYVWVFIGTHSEFNSMY